VIRRLEVVERILGANEQIAEENRLRLEAARVFAVNIMASPGAGKTSLIERTVQHLAPRCRLGVVDGDIATSIDAERAAAAGATAVQINTGGACHLDAAMLRGALDELDLSAIDLLIVENVGNLVCPAEVSLGEDARVVLLSVTEGDEKPLKYPLVFRTADLLVITKTDLLPHVKFDLEKVRRAARAANPAVEIFEVSAVSGAGLPALLDRFEALRAAKCPGA
jgi:hydrogenase nickel incorporation protein HypB